MGLPRPFVLIMLLASLVLLASPPRAEADGRVFRRELVAEDPVIPDQRALLHWTDGEETLVIETSVNSGADQDLAWVVPLPLIPGVEETPTGLFPLLAEAMGPEITKENPWWTALLALTLLTWATLSRKEGFSIRLVAVSLSWLTLLALMAIGLAGCPCGTFPAVGLTVFGGDGKVNLGAAGIG